MNKILKNISWMVFDKFFTLFFQFFIGIKIANYYGSTIYGTYSYLVTIAAFSSIFFELINGRIVKKYYTEENYNHIIYNFTFFRNTIAILLFLLAIIIKIFIKLDTSTYLILIFLTLDNVLVTTTTGIENFYEYKLEMKKIVISNNIVKILSYSLQYIGILLTYPIIMVPIIRCFANFLRIFFLKFTYKKIYKIDNKSRIDKNLVSSIIKDSFYLWASFVAFLIYTQIDKLMLGIILGKKEVGIYTISLQLVNILTIIILPIQTILFTKLLELYKENYRKYIVYYFKMNLFLTQFYLVIIFLSIFVVKYTFSLVFSSQYSEAILAYNILTIGSLMKANAALQTGHMTLKNITKKNFYKTIFGVIINVLLNYILIKKYGLSGAAWATSITQIFTLLIIDFFIKEYREQAFIQLKSFNTLYLIQILKRRKN